MQLYICVIGNHKKRFEENGWELPKQLKYDINRDIDWYARDCEMFANSSVIEKSSRHVEPMDVGNFIAGDGVSESTYFKTKGHNEIWVEYDANFAISECSCRFYSLRKFYEEVTTAVNEYYRIEFPYHMFYTKKEYNNDYALWMYFFEEEEYLKRLKENNIKSEGNYFISDDGSVYQCEVKKLTQNTIDGKKDLHWSECNMAVDSVGNFRKLSANEMMKIFDERFGED